MGGLLKRKTTSSSPPFLAFFFLIFLERSVSVALELDHSKYSQVSNLRLERIQRHLDKINKPAVMTIQVYIHIFFSI